MNENLLKFIYLFKAPTDDSNLVNIFEMSDLFYRSTAYFTESKKNETEQPEEEIEDAQKVKEEAEAKAKAKADAEEKNRIKAMEDYLNDNLSLNEELFYTKLQTIMKECMNEDTIYDLYVLLSKNHLIKKSS